MQWRYAAKKMDASKVVPQEKVHRIVEAARLAPTSSGLGASLIAAAFEEVDSTPMEGFDPKSVDEILGLGAKGLRSVALLPLGYRAKGQDWLENLKKIRRPVSEFVTEVK
jgi:nitroreductase